MCSGFRARALTLSQARYFSRRLASFFVLLSPRGAVAGSAPLAAFASAHPTFVNFLLADNETQASVDDALAAFAPTGPLFASAQPPVLSDWYTARKPAHDWRLGDPSPASAVAVLATRLSQLDPTAFILVLACGPVKQQLVCHRALKRPVGATPQDEEKIAMVAGIVEGAMVAMCAAVPPPQPSSTVAPSVVLHELRTRNMPVPRSLLVLLSAGPAELELLPSVNADARMGVWERYGVRRRVHVRSGGASHRLQSETSEQLQRLSPAAAPAPAASPPVPAASTPHGQLEADQLESLVFAHDVLPHAELLALVSSARGHSFVFAVQRNALRPVKCIKRHWNLVFCFMFNARVDVHAHCQHCKAEECCHVAAVAPMLRDGIKQWRRSLGELHVWVTGLRGAILREAGKPMHVAGTATRPEAVLRLSRTAVELSGFFKSERMTGTDRRVNHRMPCVRWTDSCLPSVDSGDAMYPPNVCARSCCLVLLLTALAAALPPSSLAHAGGSASRSTCRW